MSFQREFEHRADLLRAAVTEFGERGYERASINRILAASGMSKGQLYHHFTNKEGLYLALVGWMIDRKRDWLVAHPVDAAGDFVSLLGAQIETSLDFAAAHPEIDRLSRAVLAERGRPIYAVVVARYGFDPDSALGGLIEQHYAKGHFRAELSLDFVRRVVLTLVNSLPDLLDLDRPDDLRSSIDEMLAFLRGGLLRADVEVPSARNAARTDDGQGQ